jgi:Zn-dependent peptidase ImmA (M78 family)
MTLRHGFKSEANNLALEVRAELRLEPNSPVCPLAIAENLGIPVFTVSKLFALDGGLAAKAEDFLITYRSAFSAITVFDGNRRCIVHNHSHAHVRQRSNISHELAHALLMHPPHPPFCSNGDRIYKRELEEEASWLGPVLLETNEGARWAMARGMSVTDAAKHFEVSEDLMQFRFRMSGAQRIQRRRRR